MDDVEERVRERAYKLWVEEGKPQGRADAHWDMAAELVAIEDNQRATLKPVPAEGGEPVESAEIAANSGEVPTLTDQGEQVYPPRRAKGANKTRTAGG